MITESAQILHEQNFEEEEKRKFFEEKETSNESPYLPIVNDFGEVEV